MSHSQQISRLYGQSLGQPSHCFEGAKSCFYTLPLTITFSLSAIFLLICYTHYELQMDMTCIPFSRVSTTVLAWNQAPWWEKNTNNALKALKNIVCKTSYAAEWLADFLWPCSACYFPFPHQRAWSWVTEVFVVLNNIIYPQLLLSKGTLWRKFYSLITRPNYSRTVNSSGHILPYLTLGLETSPCQ